MARDESPVTPISAERPALQPNARGLTIRGQIDRADVAALCDRALALIEAVDAQVVVCDVGAIVDPDASVVDALARLQLFARRVGRRIRISHASSELQDLLTLTGLIDIVPPDAPDQPSRRGGSPNSGK